VTGMQFGRNRDQEESERDTDDQEVKALAEEAADGDYETF